MSQRSLDAEMRVTGYDSITGNTVSLHNLPWLKNQFLTLEKYFLGPDSATGEAQSFKLRQKEAPIFAGKWNWGG